MTAALPLETASTSTGAMPKPVVLLPGGDPDPAARSPSRALDLSRSRTHDAVLGILKAYKLSGNFHANLDTVLREMGVFDKVTYQVEPNPALAFPDCRHVVFTLNDNVPSDTFDSIMESVVARIGFDEPWWGRLFRGLHRPAHPARVTLTAA